MIQPGTLCLLVGYHGFAGQCCAVLSGPHEGCVLGRGREQVPGPFYFIDVRGVTHTRCGHPLAALRCNLVPLTPPGITTDERTQEPAAA